MNTRFEVHIEDLVLHGVTPAHARRIAAALEHGVAELLVGHVHSDWAATQTGLGEPVAATAPPPAPATPEVIGAGVAQAVVEAMRP